MCSNLHIMSLTRNPLCHAAPYNMRSHPPSMFDPSLLLRPPEKPVLAGAILALLTPNQDHRPRSVCAGWWSTWSAHPMDMRIYIQLHNESCALSTSQGMWEYGEAFSAFDGYKGTPTNGMTQQRWAGERTAVTVTFDEDMPLTMKKDNAVWSHMDGTSRFSNSS